jgi:protoporphyrinogen oxidase
MTDSTQARHAIVVGAGLAGLSCAFRLQQGGWRVTVLEAGDRVGGRVLTKRADGHLYDVGPTLVSDKYTEYLKLLDELGLSDRVVPSSALVGVVSVGRDGNELHVLDAARPIRSFARTKLLSTGAKLKLIARGRNLLKPLHKLNPYELSNKVHYDTESMQSYLDRVFGPELNESLLAAVARGVTLSTPQEASVIEFFAGAAAASGKMVNVVGSLDVLPDALAKRLDVRLNAPVTEIVRDGAGVEVHFGAGQVDHADACVITTPFADAVEMYPTLKEAGSELLSATTYTGCYTLALRYDRRPPPEREPYIVMVPKAASAEVAAVFLEHVKAPDRAPDGESQFLIFYNLADDPPDGGFAAWSDERLLDVGRGFVEQLFPEVAGGFLGSQVTRWSYAAHKGNVGYYAALDSFLRSHPSDEPVQVAGDWMSVAGQESAVVAGVQAAARVAAGVGVSRS